MSSFSALYNDLTTMKARELLKLTTVFSFVSDELFPKSLPNPSLLETLRISITAYRSEIESMVGVLLVKFAGGISTQRDAISNLTPIMKLDHY